MTRVRGGAWGTRGTYRVRGNKGSERGLGVTRDRVISPEQRITK